VSSNGRILRCGLEIGDEMVLIRGYDTVDKNPGFESPTSSTIVLSSSEAQVIVVAGVRIIGVSNIGTSTASEVDEEDAGERGGGRSLAEAIVNEGKRSPSPFLMFSTERA